MPKSLSVECVIHMHRSLMCTVHSSHAQGITHVHRGIIRVHHADGASFTCIRHHSRARCMREVSPETPPQKTSPVPSIQCPFKMLSVQHTEGFLNSCLSPVFLSVFFAVVCRSGAEVTSRHGCREIWTECVLCAAVTPGQTSVPARLSAAAQICSNPVPFCQRTKENASN